MSWKTLLCALMTASVVLAGCTDDAETDSDGTVEGKVDDPTTLKAGKGAISGLLVDDRFRPIDLTDDPTTEFQAEGFVLLQETGQEVRTNENGEFTFLDLDPGTYTLRVQAQGHEATPKQVTVEEGLFAEATVIARRTTSVDSLIITEELSAFIPCAASWVAPPGAPDAVTFSCLDSSGESYRSAALTNFTGFANATYLIVEVLAARNGNYDVETRENNGGNSGGLDVADYPIRGGRYGKMIIPYIEDAEAFAAMEDKPEYLTGHWNNSFPLESIPFYAGDYAGGVPVPGLGEPGKLPCVSDEDVTNILGERCVDLSEDWETSNVGAGLGIRHKFILSLFVGEPEVDLDAYQLLTEESS